MRINSLRTISNPQGILDKDGPIETLPHKWAVEMSQGLGALAIPAEELGSFPSTNTLAHNNFDTSSGLSRQAHGVHIHN